MTLKHYEALQELLEDVYLANAAREALADEERIPWEQVKAELDRGWQTRSLDVFTITLTRQARKDLAGLDASQSRSE